MLVRRSGPIAKQKPPNLRLVAWEFFCKVCANEFEADWAPEQNVICSRCGTAFETSYQLTARGDLVGAWLTRRAPIQG
jgi:hypothetical protein